MPSLQLSEDLRMPADTELEAADHTDAAPTSKLRGCFKGLAIGAAVVGVMLLGVYALVGMNSKSGVQIERERLSAAGAPMTYADLLGPDPAPEENAASDLEAAFVAMTRASGKPYVQNKYGSDFSPAMQAIVDAIDLPLAERFAIYATALEDPDLQEALVALEAAAAKPHCRFYRAEEMSTKLRLPPFSLARNTSRLLAADALHKAAAGDEEAAWARIHQGLMLARHLSETPLVIAYAVAVVCEEVILTAALDMQPWLQAPMPAWLLAESGHFDIFANPAPFVAALDGERIGNDGHYFHMTDKLADEMIGIFSGSDEEGLVRWYTSYPMKPVRNIDHRTYLSTMRAIRETLVSRTFDPDIIGRTSYKSKIPPYCFMTRILVPYLHGSINGSHVLTVRLQRLALVACDERRRTGAFPADFAALVKALPPELAATAKDPALVTPARPLIYRVDGEGIILYGYGRDGADSGGYPGADVVVTATFSLPPPITPPEAELPADARVLDLWDD